VPKMLIDADTEAKQANVLRSECGGTRWRTGEEVKGKLANGVCSQYSHMTLEGGVSSITNSDAHTSAASSRLNWLPRQFKWTRSFRRKTNCGLCACAIRFHTSSTTDLWYQNDAGYESFPSQTLMQDVTWIHNF
jgi:hypothetical protein